MEKPQRSFVRGAAVLGSLGIVAKLFGAVYTIVTSNIIGVEAMAAYNAAFPVYTFLLAMSSAGLPVAISKMVSERIALGDYRAAHAVFRTAMRAMALIGTVTTAAMIVFSSPISSALGRPEAHITMMTLAPSLLFVSIISAYRGYFQGMQRMTPTAVSQIIEQVVKLGVGIYFSYAWRVYGPEYGAAGTIFGITVSEAVAFLYMLILYLKNKKEIRHNIKNGQRTRLRHGIGSRMFYLALPIIIGSCAMPIVQLADAGIINNSLLAMDKIILLGKEVAVSDKVVSHLYGLVSLINSVINMPAVLSLALGMSLVPSISASKAREDLEGVANKSSVAFKLSMLIGLPSTIGLYLLSTPVIYLLYSGSLYASSDPMVAQLNLLSEAGLLLAINAVSMLSLTVLQTMTGILQGLGKTYIPVINLFIGIIVKIAVSLVTINIPAINIQGAFYGTLACYSITALLDVICVVSHTGAKLKVFGSIVKPLLASAAMGAFVYLMIPYITVHTSHGAVIYSKPWTGAVILAAIPIYLIFALLFGAVNGEDLSYVPGGRALSKAMVKLRLWKAKA